MDKYLSLLNNLVLFRPDGTFYKSLANPFRLYREVIGAHSKLPAFNKPQNLFKLYLSFMLAGNINAYSLSAERKKRHTDDSLSKLALFDLEIYYKLFNADLTEIFDGIDAKYLEVIKNFEISQISENDCPDLLGDIANSRSAKELLDNLNEFYYRHGIGEMAFFKAFTAYPDKYNEALLKPTDCGGYGGIESIIGHEIQKNALLKNTKDFVKSGHLANNVLLYGDAGTGKSTCVKALPKIFGEKGLRLIGLSKENTYLLSSLGKTLAKRNYKFIIFLDDISFEDNETGYKELKSVIEGDVAKMPPNVLIYATSNRRHLIKENFSERQDGSTDEIHISDTLEEKMSLSSRFGIKIRFDKPSQKEFLRIISLVAKDYGLDGENEELVSKAKSWAISNGGFTGRNARQFLAAMSDKS